MSYYFIACKHFILPCISKLNLTLVNLSFDINANGECRSHSIRVKSLPLKLETYCFKYSTFFIQYRMIITACEELMQESNWDVKGNDENIELSYPLKQTVQKYFLFIEKNWRFSFKKVKYSPFYFRRVILSNNEPIAVSLNQKNQVTLIIRWWEK